MQALTQKRALRGMGLLAALALLSVVVAACGSSSNNSSSSAASTSGGAANTTAASSKVKKIAIATPAKTNDYGWNSQGVAAANSAAGAVGATVDVSSDLGYDKTQTVLRQIALTKPQLIIAHASGYDTAAQRIGQQYKIPTVTYDIPSMKSPGAVSNITTESQQAAYLAGILAAHQSKTGKVGVIISASDSNWFKMAGGYAAGVHSVKPKMPIAFAEISSAGYDDAAGGKRVATSMIAGGADVIFAMGDGASFGYLQAIETANPGHKVWYIGDIGDMTPIDKKGVLLSSVLWDFTGAYKQFIKEIDGGTFGQKGYDLTLANGGVSLLKTKHIPASVWSDIQAAQKKIVAGQIQVPNYSKINQVKAALNG
ncbi:MAG TPA: BMP family ABC transporter substrate-binding protein [Solirubrobacteraceae bacterium]|jgi:simple sugar transport system substrate-binding protein|nr:BMP family ABC transporter substrate-binding protein [Solirubrobacteraceae bacterium]